MYGITDGQCILVDYGYRPGGLSLANINDNKSVFYKAVMVESAQEADRLLQEATVHFGNYNLRVYRFTEEEEAAVIIRKLKGY